MKSNQVAVFNIYKTFKITGRGLVIVGQIAGGEINGGDILQVNIEGTKCQFLIDSVEYVDNVDVKEVKIGLFVTTLDLSSIVNSDTFIGQRATVLNKV